MQIQARLMKAKTQRHAHQSLHNRQSLRVISSTANHRLRCPKRRNQSETDYLVSSASMRALSASFSSRAFCAMPRTASNSSRVTKSRSYQPAVHQRFHGVFRLIFSALRHAHRIGHQLRHVVHELVTGLHRVLHRYLLPLYGGAAPQTQG